MSTSDRLPRAGIGFWSETQSGMDEPDTNMLHSRPLMVVDGCVDECGGSVVV